VLRFHQFAFQITYVKPLLHPLEYWNRQRGIWNDI
jgi:hypothetical protein